MKRNYYFHNRQMAAQQIKALERLQAQAQQPKVDTGSLPDNLLDVLSPKEAIRIAYVPVIMTKAAYRFADRVTQTCISWRLPYAKQSRMIKQSKADWEQECDNSLSNEVMVKLEDQLNDFLAVAGWDVQCLWWVINQELKKRYPELEDEYPLLSDLFVCKSLLDYTRQKEDQFADLLKERTGVYPPHPVPWYIQDLRKALDGIYGRYTLDPTPMIKMAINVIDRKVENEIFTDVEVTND